MRLPGAGIEGGGFVIRERTGRTRSITLSGRAGPFRGPTWALQQRTKKTKYAGNPEATLQLFGYDVDMPTTITGMWRDRYLASDEKLVVVEGFAEEPKSAEAMVEIFSDLVRGGATLEVTWGFARRIGVLKRFEFKADRVEDVGWTAEFDWQADGQAKAKRALSLPSAPNLDQVKAAMTALSDHVAFDPVDTLLAFEAQLFSKISELQDRVEDLLTGARVLANALTLPARVVSAVTASATSIAFSAGQVIETVVGAPYTTVQVVDDLGAVLRAEVYRRETAALASDLRSSALGVADAFQKRAEPDPIRVVRADATGSLRAVAQREYGKGDAWGVIADANGFEDAFVPPGTELFIPPSPGPVGAT